MRLGTWKLVRDGGSGRLFDLQADPGERKDLASRRPEKAAELRQRLAEWEREMAGEQPAFVVK